MFSYGRILFKCHFDFVCFCPISLFVHFHLPRQNTYWTHSHLKKTKFFIFAAILCQNASFKIRLFIIANVSISTYKCIAPLLYFWTVKDIVWRILEYNRHFSFSFRPIALVDDDFRQFTGEYKWEVIHSYENAWTKKSCSQIGDSKCELGWQNAFR